MHGNIIIKFLCTINIYKEIARHWWLTPIILDTQEVEIRKMVVQSQPQANSSRPYLKKGWGHSSRGSMPLGKGLGQAFLQRYANGHLAYDKMP
jgi:hypothetical protein